MPNNDPREWAISAPERPAIIMATSGEFVTYAAFAERINRISALLRERGLGPGDVVVILAKNEPAFMEVCLGAKYAGIDYTPISKYLRADEISYIIQNSSAKALFVSRDLADLASQLTDCPTLHHRLVLGETTGTLEGLDDALAACDGSPWTAAAPGRELLYSSGTTGRPKGVRIHAQPDAGLGAADSVARLTASYGFDETTVNLTPAPLYHAGPLRFSTWIAATGGTNIVMEKFDAEQMLHLIERYRITHVEAVPTMLVRLLKLPKAVRDRYDLSSLRFLTHAGAPCPPDVKTEVIDWLGPIVHEQYGGTEANGLCVINSEEWLQHPGSVGRAAIGILHILRDDGTEAAPGEAGVVYFEGGSQFEYHLDPEKTASAFSPQGWSTLGDIGYLDAEGFLYLTDRKSNVIISGGVNIYPQEAENALISHPSVIDVGVFGIPDREYGETVVAAVQPNDFDQAGPELEQALIAYCRDRIATLKAPRRIAFMERLPRDDTGKLFKARLLPLFAQPDVSTSGSAAPGVSPHIQGN